MVNRLAFSKKNRLLTANQFQHVFKQGYRHRRAFFTLISYCNDQDVARLGLAIAKRHVSSAVTRNRIRRIIRESFRRYQTLLAGIDVVIIANKELRALSNDSIYADLNEQWQVLAKRHKNLS